MKRFILGMAWLALAGVGVADEPKADEAKKAAVAKALEAFTGTWEIVAVRPDGATKEARRLVFNKDGRYAAQDKDGKELWAGTFEIDPTVSPKVWDHRSHDAKKEGKDALGIYELGGDKLKVACVVGQWKGKEWFGKPRPKPIDSKEADVVIELKRDGPGKRRVTQRVTFAGNHAHLVTHGQTPSPVAGAVRHRGRGGGAGGRRRGTVPAGVGPAARGAGGVVWSDRDDHTGRTAAVIRGVGGGNVSEAGVVATRTNPLPAPEHYRNSTLSKPCTADAPGTPKGPKTPGNYEWRARRVPTTPLLHRVQIFWLRLAEPLQSLPAK